MDMIHADMYPNPARNEFNIFTSKPTAFEIFNMQGKTIYTSDLNRNTFNIDVSEWNNALLIVRFENGQTKKFVVNH